MVSEGEMVQSTPVTDAFRVVIDTILKLRLQVPERYAPEVKVGRPVEVRVDAYPDRAFAGTVARVNPTVDPLNRTFEVEVLVPNGHGQLKAGGFARAELHLRTDPAVKTVPPHALVTFAGVTKVFVVEAGKAKPIEVRTGVRDREWVEVIGPVPDGARVITSGHSQIVDGSPVKVRE
jgi:RND family efflux transporter MFP subunit